MLRALPMAEFTTVSYRVGLCALLVSCNANAGVNWKTRDLWSAPVNPSHCSTDLGIRLSQDLTVAGQPKRSLRALTCRLA